MKNHFKDSLDNSVELKTKLRDKIYTDIFQEMGNLLVKSIASGGKIMFCGNGGSAADAQHLAAELLVRLRPKFNRNPIPAIALAMDTSTITACGNDFGFDKLYERNVLAIGKQEDILICISTSGMSKNLELAALAANSLGISIIGFLGNNGGILKKHCDLSLVVPSENTARIQECHILLGHALMEFLEDKLLELRYIKLD
jgi:D-sedoheptulose 7-phosphate isomerase